MANNPRITFRQVYSFKVAFKRTSYSQRAFPFLREKLIVMPFFFRTRAVLLLSILGSFLFGRIELVLTNSEIIFCPLELTFLLRSVSKRPLNTLLRLYGLFVNCSLSQRLIYTKPSVT